MTDKLRDAAQMALEAWDQPNGINYIDFRSYMDALRAALAEQQNLQDIEQYRMQMAGICTAATGYWKEGDSIHPDYDTPALRDVAKLYAKYDELYRAKAEQQEPVAFQAREIGEGDWFQIPLTEFQRIRGVIESAHMDYRWVYTAPEAPQPKAEQQEHQPWCASLTQLLTSNPPKPAPCNCKPKAEQQEPEHITDGRPCWCEPELDYKDPETGAEVWVHRRAQ